MSKEAELVIPEGEFGQILAMSPIVKGRGMLPCRAVIRDWGDAIVVHTQIFDDALDPTGFTDGRYIPKSDEDAMRRAWQDFNRRNRRLFCWPEPSLEKA